jgi:DNA polymerase-1
LARDLKIEKQEAVDLMVSYFHEFSGVRSFIKLVHARVEAKGWVESWFGLVRRLPGVYSSNWAERETAKRQAFSFVIQSTGRQICLMWLIAAQKRIDDEGLDDHVKLINTVHDSIVFDCKDKYLKRVSGIAKDALKDVETKIKKKLKVPLVTDVHYGRSWNCGEEA